jgi:CRISPR-associated protein Cmr2
MTDPDRFTHTVARCLTHGTDARVDPVTDIVRRVLEEAPKAPGRAALEELNLAVTQGLRANNVPEAKVALVYGGATKIKGYVFEAPALPEIRGASALLEWVNDHRIAAIWRDHLGDDLGSSSIIYAGGGSFLAFAPAAKGAELASLIEQEFTCQTLTANSVAVAETFTLLELRYGCRPLDFWVEDFLREWRDPQMRAELEAYYHAPLPGSMAAQLDAADLRAALPGRTLNDADIEAARRFLQPQAVRRTGDAPGDNVQPSPRRARLCRRTAFHSTLSNAAVGGTM